MLSTLTSGIKTETFTYFRLFSEDLYMSVSLRLILRMSFVEAVWTKKERNLYSIFQATILHYKYTGCYCSACTVFEISNF